MSHEPMNDQAVTPSATPVGLGPRPSAGPLDPERVAARKKLLAETLATSRARPRTDEPARLLPLLEAIAESQLATSDLFLRAPNLTSSTLASGDPSPESLKALSDQQASLHAAIEETRRSSHENEQQILQLLNGRETTVLKDLAELLSKLEKQMQQQEAMSAAIAESITKASKLHEASLVTIKRAEVLLTDVAHKKLPEAESLVQKADAQISATRRALQDELAKTHGRLSSGLRLLPVLLLLTSLTAAGVIALAWKSAGRSTASPSGQTR